ncbi:MAG: hypothetical protein KDA58_17245, partial [Planctomycetaceae bacterium]|nr:hypothetical protein [Planctomycetaceae bacterium]
TVAAIPPDAEAQVSNKFQPDSDLPRCDGDSWPNIVIQGMRPPLLKGKWVQVLRLLFGLIYSSFAANRPVLL